MTLGDLYSNYKKNNPDTEISVQEFKKASKLIFNLIVEDLLSGNRYSLPHGLGVLYLDKFKLNGKKIDYGASKKFGKTIYHTNFHSDGMTYKLKWDKYSNRFKNKKLYNFKLTRAHSRRLSSLIKQNKIKIFKHYG